jgi:methanogenic corrinoid protein MtbC1
LSLTETEAQQERMVIDLLKNMVDLDMKTFERSLDVYIDSRGIEKAIIQIIFPFLEKIGVLWQTSHIIPAQEHLVSNIIRQKLCVGIDSVETSLNLNRSVCCFLPEGEFHELGLLFMHYMMRSRGITVIYLGASVPLNDLEYIVNEKNPDFLYTHISTMGHNFHFERFMNHLTKKFAGRSIILTGHMAKTNQKKIPAKILYRKSPSEVLDLVTAES